QLLAAQGVPVPPSYFVIESFHQTQQVGQMLADLDDFVIKPAQGSGGGGIVVITRRDEHGWYSPSGSLWTVLDIQRHVADIVFGTHSFDLGDFAIFEQRLRPAPLLHKLSPWGLADLRVIVLDHKPVMAMCRLPTKASGGRANLHQGAVGVGINLKTGRSTHAIHAGMPIILHPDHGENLIGLELPDWKECLTIAQRCGEILPLKYLGVDLAMTDEGPKVLEVNARPGLAIQLANDCGLRPALFDIVNAEAGA
ncbi:MAG TPA: sugar-transfer associated ATP-grasp domain-containing protein, partial [Gammaproteobacteria bacterium]|nr:sugar-transfer associated ATP-grasp domain-containing protein [Gammaproteobacteria bacterium]